MDNFLSEFTPEDFTGNIGVLLDGDPQGGELESALDFLRKVYEAASRALDKQATTRHYWANCLIDRHGISSTPYLQSHYTCCLDIEEARKIIEKFREDGGVLLSYIQEYVGDDEAPNILELKSYVNSCGIGPRELEEVDRFAHYSPSGRIIVYEINDDLWAQRFIGKTLYDGHYKECPKEILRRKVMKVWDVYKDNEDADEDMDITARKFIVFKEDEKL